MWMTSTFAKFLESESHIVLISTLTCVWQSSISDTCLVYLWQRHLFLDVFTWTIQLQCQRAEMDRPRTPSRCSGCVWIWGSSKLRNVWLGNIQPVIVPFPRDKIPLTACSNRHDFDVNSYKSFVFYICTICACLTQWIRFQIMQHATTISEL
jgi:hypothetical protein